MNIFDIKGLGFIQNINLGVWISRGQTFLLLIGLIVLFTAVGLFVVHRLNKKKVYNKHCSFFREVNGEMVLIEECYAWERPIPGTNFTVFYIKEKDMYLPRPIRSMGKNTFLFCIRKNREIVNFSIKSLDKEMKEAGLDYDHTDMRYAMVNLKEIIKRNYTDKSIPWWREYKETITLVIIIFVLTLSFLAITWYTKNLINAVGQLIDRAETIITHADQLVQSGCSGVSSGIAVK